MRTKLTTDALDARKSASEAIRAHKAPIIGCLDNIRSLYNVGSMFRTADGAGIESLLLLGFTPQPPRKEISKTALGSVDTVPWRHCTSTEELYAIVKERGATLCVLEQTSDSIPHSALRPEHFPLFLVVGNELTGVRHELVEIADVALEIPMFGEKHSLNAAVAFGIGVYEALRVWRNFPVPSQSLR